MSRSPDIVEEDSSIGKETCGYPDRLLPGGAGSGGVNLQQEPIPKELSVAFRSIFIHNGNRLSGVQVRG